MQWMAISTLSLRFERAAEQFSSKAIAWLLGVALAFIKAKSSISKMKLCRIVRCTCSSCCIDAGSCSCTVIAGRWKEEAISVRLSAGHHILYLWEIREHDNAGELGGEMQAGRVGSCCLTRKVNVNAFYYGIFIWAGSGWLAMFSEQTRTHSKFTCTSGSLKMPVTRPARPPSQSPCTHRAFVGDLFHVLSSL